LAYLKGKERADYVQQLFTHIASNYDRVNRIMTIGQDLRWRRDVILRARLNPGERLLDLGTGTGDLARETRIRYPTVQVIAADFTLEMMRVGKARDSDTERAEHKLDWSGADALHLPFEDNTFDAVVSGFLLRNVSDLCQSLTDQFRVLKPGGRFVALDTTPPADNLLKPFIQFHMRTVIPALGRLVAHQGEAYLYLPDSTENFLQPIQLADHLQAVGFVQVAFQRMMFGTIAIHWGEKPGNDC